MLATLLLLGKQFLSDRPLPIETNILALLPANQQQPLADAAFEQIAGSLSDKVIFVVGSNDKSHLFEAGREFSQQIASIGLFKQVTSTVSESQQQAWGKLYFPHRAQLLTTEQRNQLENTPEQRVQAVLQALYNPFSGVTGQELASDPFLLFRGYLGELGKRSGNVRIEQGFLTTDYQGKHYLLITADLSGSAYSPELQAKLPELAAIEHSIESQFEVSLLHTGVIYYAAHGTNSAKSEISTIGVGSLIGVVLLLVVVFRSPLPLVLSLLSIGCGLLVALATTVAIFGKIHLFSLVFGASLIGVSIDYSLHFLTERLAAGKQWQASKGLSQIFVAITLGMLMSLVGYLCMMAAPFPGLQQLSLFSAVGLVAAYATVVCWYPILAAKSGGDRLLPLRGAMAVWLSIWQRPSVRVVLPVFCVAISVLGTFRAGYDDDIRQLQALPADLKQQEQSVKAITGMDGGQQMLLVTGNKPEQLLQALERVGQSLDGMVRDKHPALAGYQSLAQYVPSAKWQEENYQLVSNLYQQYGSQLANSLGLQKTVEFKADFKPLTMDDFLRSPASAPLRFLWLGKQGDLFASVILLKGVTQPDVIISYAASQPNVLYLDKAREVSSLFGIYRQHVTELFALAALGILLILFWRYGVVKGIRVISAPAIACVVGVGIAGFTGVPLNLFNLLGLFLILGIGIDYSLFFAERSQGQTTLLAITLSAVTTILSFGLLSLSATQAIHSFGVTVLTGILTAWLLAPLARDRVVGEDTAGATAVMEKV